MDCTTKTSRAADVLLDLDGDFAVGEAPDPRGAERRAQVVRDLGGKARIGVAGENHEVRVLSLHECVPAMRIGSFGRAAKILVSEFGREKGFEPLHAGIKIQCLNQLGDSPTGSTTNVANRYMSHQIA